MRLTRIHPVLWLFAVPTLLCMTATVVRPDEWQPVTQAQILEHKVYAYRQWQSTGVRVEEGDTIRLRASGEWLYSPFVGPNGPDGGEWAPDWYPLSGSRAARGGTLIGRVGEEGVPFPVGRGTEYSVRERGTLYLRINDDLLGDNRGALDVQIGVIPAPETD